MCKIRFAGLEKLNGTELTGKTPFNIDLIEIYPRQNVSGYKKPTVGLEFIVLEFTGPAIDLSL